MLLAATTRIVGGRPDIVATTAVAFGNGQRLLFVARLLLLFVAACVGSNSSGSLDPRPGHDEQAPAAPRPVLRSTRKEQPCAFEFTASEHFTSLVLAWRMSAAVAE